MEPQAHLEQLRSATADLLRDIDGLSDADVRAPSPLPGWTRGHVLTHLARNAEGSTRLLIWARTGVPSYEYENHQVRAAEIEQGAGRPAKVLIADVTDTADAFFAAADGMPGQAWQRTVTFTGGYDVAVAGLRGFPEFAVRLEATDTDRVYEPAEAAHVVKGPEYAILAWLIGRSDGSELAHEGDAALPPVPQLYSA
jgi:maleylpyruvate isomerase